MKRMGEGHAIVRMRRWRRAALSGAATIVAASLLAACTADPPVPKRTTPPQPPAMSSESARALDVCGLIPEGVLGMTFQAEGAVTTGIGTAPGGCDVTITAPGSGARSAYTIVPIAWPGAAEWSRIAGGPRSSAQGGGWLVVGAQDQPPQTAVAYTKRGIAYRITAANPGAGDRDVRREQAILSLLLTSAAKTSVPEITWSRGALLAEDLCAAATAAGFPQRLGLADPEPRPLAATSPDARSCTEKAADGKNPRFQVHAALVNGLDTAGGAQKASIGGHEAVQTWDGRMCRTTIAFPDDPALTGRVAPGGPHTTALSVTVERPCAQVADAAAALVEQLDGAH